jgi:hypothetical protein
LCKNHYGLQVGRESAGRSFSWRILENLPVPCCKKTYQRKIISTGVYITPIQKGGS